MSLFVRKLKALMAERGVPTPTELGEASQIDVSVICRWLRDETKPGGKNLIRLLRWAGDALSEEDVYGQEVPRRRRRAAQPARGRAAAR